jgi:hypothetical protein
MMNQSQNKIENLKDKIRNSQQNKISNFYTYIYMYILYIYNNFFYIMVDLLCNVGKLVVHCFSHAEI